MKTLLLTSLSWIRKYYNIFLFLSICYILIYQIPFLRNIAKSILDYINYLFNHFFNITISINMFINLYKSIEFLIIFFILITTIYIFIYKLYSIIHHKRIELSKSPKNSFEKSLLEYIENKQTNQSYLIAGSWGTGKTHAVNNFFEKFYSHSSKKIYRISCFGLTTREQILKEINYQQQRTDQSFYSSFILVAQHIPFIGDLLYKLLGRDYDFYDIKDNSIFIFDDFERISINDISNSKNPKVYKRNPFLKSDLKKYGLEKIDNEYENIEKGFDNLISSNNQQIKHSYLEKYNTICGLINELSESLHAKIVIICNTDTIPLDYLDNILLGKLNCIKYSMPLINDNTEEIINQAIKNYIFKDDTLKKDLKIFLLESNKKFGEEIMKLLNYNLRFYITFINNYLSTLLHIETNTVFKSSIENNKSNTFFNDLFFSQFILFYLEKQNRTTFLHAIPTGSCLKLYLKIFNENRLFNIIPNTIKWTGIPISGEMIPNISSFQDNSNVSDYFTYPHYDLESKMVLSQSPDSFLEENSINLFHFIFLSSLVNYQERTLLKKYIDKIQIPYESEEMEYRLYVSLSILDMVDNTLLHDLKNELLLKLYNISKISSVENKTNTHSRYNDLVMSSIDSSQDN